MSDRIAIGVGCRLGCSADAIEALIRQALNAVSAARPIAVFTIRDKAGEPGLVEAVSRLGLDLVLLPREALRAQSARVQTRSHAAARLFGVPSVAEAAALAGAGSDAMLIVPRMTNRGATCAIAASRP